MRNHPHAGILESLENRTLFAVREVGTFGADPADTLDDRAAIQAALNASSAGDKVVFENGDYIIGGSLSINSGIELAGAADTNLQFTTANNGFAIQLATNASNVWIHHLKIRANCGVIIAPGYSVNLKVTDNRFEWGYDGTYYNRLAIRSLGSSNGMIIERNLFTESWYDRAVDLNNVSNGSYSYNNFYRINDGGHLDGKTVNFRFVGNRGEQIHRMGLELQDHNTTTTNHSDNILISGNVFFDWYQPYWDSFGLSIIPQRATNVIVENNYISARYKVGGWGVTDSGGTHRYGYAIELGYQSGEARGNTLIGSWVAHLVVAIQNMLITNNNHYGRTVWNPQYVYPEPGLNGMGSAIVTGQFVDIDVTHAPPPPDYTGGDGNDGIDPTLEDIIDEAVEGFGGDLIPAYIPLLNPNGVGFALPPDK